jgi:hypothetical protein
VILTLIAAVIMVMIARITGWFTAWYILSASFFLIVIRRAIVIYAPFSGIPVQLAYINSVILFVLSIMFVVGFYKLYVLFKENKRQY